MKKHKERLCKDCIYNNAKGCAQTVVILGGNQYHSKKGPHNNCFKQKEQPAPSEAAQAEPKNIEN